MKLKFPQIISLFMMIITIPSILGDDEMTINDPDAEKCVMLDRYCPEGAACVRDDFNPKQYECECTAGSIGDGITNCIPPPVYLTIAPDMTCNQSTPHTCFVTSDIGQSVRMSVQAQGALTSTRWKINWYRFYDGLPPIFHSFRESIDASSSPYDEIHMDENNSVLTVSDIREDEVYPNRFIAEILQSDWDVPGVTGMSGVEAMDLNKAEWLNPTVTRVYFMVETKPIEIGPFLTASDLELDLNQYLTTDLDTDHLHYRWASEGDVETLGRRDRIFVDENDSTLSLYGLGEEQLNGVVRGMAFGRNGRLPGRVLLASQRFKLREDKSRTCVGPLSERICTCRKGYTLEGTHCVDMDECQSPVSPCLMSATCINTDGSFHCECPRGYQGDGVSFCSDVDECSIGQACHRYADCTNTDGSFMCTCAEGYIGDGQLECSAVSEWADWSDWSVCSASCGPATRSRRRECTHPESGMICFGPSSDRDECPDNPPCPVDGGWSAWSQWTPCTSSCAGRRQRVRVCDRPTPEFGGQFCEGDMYTVDLCGDISCPVPGEWGAWDEWAECSEACAGTQARRRDCVPYHHHGDASRAGGEALCEQGDEWESRTCYLVHNIAACGSDYEEGPTLTWGEWTHWSHCSLTCGTGMRYRRRTCPTRPAEPGYRSGQDCKGQHRQTEPCLERKCSAGRPGSNQWNYA